MDWNNCVSIAKADSCRYVKPDTEFRPSIKYPEYEFGDLSVTRNDVYDTVRNALHLLGLDNDNFGSPSWNPLGEIVKPGDTVLIKPNWVQHFNVNKNAGTECLYTQPSVIAPIVDYVIKALKGQGKITIGDAPMQECDLNVLFREAGYDTLVDFYRKKGVEIELVDFRKHVSVVRHRVQSKTIKSDVKGTVINLSDKSEFYGTDRDTVAKFRIVNYPHENLMRHHTGNTQEYFVSDYVLEADVIINVPKPKTHKKAGITAALKNLVGINVQKDYLPHHTFGSSVEGGDEYLKKSWLQDIRSRLYDKKYSYEEKDNFWAAKFVWFFIAFCTVVLRIRGVKYENGSWYGNHTISRTITDLNKILFFVDKDGIFHEKPIRKMFIVGDMIVSGEKNGPVAPGRKEAGLIAAGTNPLRFDEVVTTVMGFDPDKIPTIKNVRRAFGVKQNTTVIRSDVEFFDGKKFDEIPKNMCMNFAPPDGWQGHIER